MLSFDKVLYDSEDAVTHRLQERASSKRREKEDFLQGLLDIVGER
jgi:hypothetical protein